MSVLINLYYNISHRNLINENGEDIKHSIFLYFG